MQQSKNCHVYALLLNPLTDGSELHPFKGLQLYPLLWVIMIHRCPSKSGTSSTPALSAEHLLIVAPVFGPSGFLLEAEVEHSLAYNWLMVPCVLRVLHHTKMLLQARCVTSRRE